MPDPQKSLPPEVFDQVLSFAVVETHLPRLCLVGREWYSILVPQLYHTWTYDGAYNGFRQLWLFLRTIVQNPRLAALVQDLWIGNWGVNLYSLLDRDFDLHFPVDDLDPVRRAIRHAGLGDLETVMIQSLGQGDRRPLMALLLTLLPNVTAIHAHVPLSDPFLFAVLQRALDLQENGDTFALSNMRELYVFGEVSISDTPVPEVMDWTKPQVPLRLNHVWPVLYFKNLQTLSIFDLDAEGASSLLEKYHKSHSKASSHIRNLVLTTHKMSGCKTADIQTLITIPPSLSSLSLYIDDEAVQDMPSKISNAEIWDAVAKHQSSLEFLDLFYFTPSRKPDDPHRGHLGSLQSFPNLQRLNVHLQSLIGGTPQPILLKNVLPTALRSVTLYACYDFYRALDLASQLQEVLTENLCPALSSITLDERGHWASSTNQGINDKNFQKILRDKHVDLQVEMTCSPTTVEIDCQIPQAGRCVLSWGWKMYNMRISGQQRYLDTMQKLFRSDDDDYHDDSDAVSEAGSPISHILSVHVLPFTDHAGNTAYMLFQNYNTCQLPPLLSYTIYFTHPETVPGERNMKGLWWALTAFGPEFEPRFDIFFLPGASEEACGTHYRAERASRGSYMSQVRAYRERRALEIRRPPPPPGKLPGMGKEDMGPNTGGIFFMCTERNWEDGQQALWFVTFFPSGQGTESAGESDGNFNHRHLVEAEHVEESQENDVHEGLTFEKVLLPIQQESSMWEEVGYSVDKWMADEHYPVRDEVEPIWKNASKRGWTNW